VGALGIFFQLLIFFMMRADLEKNIHLGFRRISEVQYAKAIRGNTRGIFFEYRRPQSGAQLFSAMPTQARALRRAGSSPEGRVQLPAPIDPYCNACAFSPEGRSGALRSCPALLNPWRIPPSKQVGPDFKRYMDKKLAIKLNGGRHITGGASPSPQHTPLGPRARGALL